MKLTDSDRQMRETVIEFASCLYGGAWRERLAEVSGMPKRAVADWFKSDKALPPAIPLAILRAMQNDVEAQIAEKQALCERVKAVRLELIAQPTTVETSEAKKDQDLKILASAKDLSVQANDDHSEEQQLEIPSKTRKPFAARRANKRTMHNSPLRLVVSRNL